MCGSYYICTYTTNKLGGNMARNSKSSYKKDVRIPLCLWEQIKNKENVSQYIIEAVKEKLSKEGK